jgi:arylsulfatase A-like enzyme
MQMNKETANGKTSKFLSQFKSLNILFLFLSIFLFTPFCVKKEDFSVYRFIDHFNEENILISPFQYMVEDPEGFKNINPVLYDIAGKFPLMDSGIGKNPLLIKKKMKIGPLEINTLLAPPNSHYKFPVRLPLNSLLEFTYGIRRDNELLTSGKGSRNVTFKIILEVREQKKEIFTKTLNLNPSQSLVFDYKKIDLSDFAKEESLFYFQTHGSKKALAGWFNPVLYVPQQRTKNVILVSLDTLRADHVGCYGYPRETTPHIDELAKDSVVFLNTFASSPWTLPSHVSLMTALNCINHQVYYNDRKIDPALLTLADVLRQHSYSNGAITGGAFVSGSYGFNKGFDSYHVRGNITAKDQADRICRASVDWIERHKDRNFFLFVHTYQIHSPYASPPPYNESFLSEEAMFNQFDLRDHRFYQENRFTPPVNEKFRQNIIDIYDGGIRYTDEVLIGALIEELKASKIYDNTMLIILSDHGEEFYEHKGWAHSHSVYNELIKVPLIIKFFDSEYAGVNVTKYARLIDVMPTILDALGIAYPKQYADGETLLKLINNKGKRNEERIFLAELATDPIDGKIPKKTAINQRQNKLIINEAYDSQNLPYFNSPPPKLEKFEIYDLMADPQEKANTALSNPSLIRQLLRFMEIHFVQKCEWNTGRAESTEEIREQLRALGYIK